MIVTEDLVTVTLDLGPCAPGEPFLEPGELTDINSTLESGRTHTTKAIVLEANRLTGEVIVLAEQVLSEQDD